MSSGGKRINITLKERPTSGDVNRLQTLAAAGVAEVLHSIYEGRPTIETGAGGIESTAATSMALRSTVLSGLRCDPQAGVTDLLISPGVLVARSPDVVPDADDSDFKWIVDPGVVALGSLNLTPNGAGAPRIDVVECSVNDTLEESANREVWDEATGQFLAPAPVQKVRSRLLTYRIREGVAGAGYPGTVAGWLPLMVSSAPAGALVWDDCVLWDVRPLAADLHSATGLSRDGRRVITYQEATCEPAPLPPAVPLANLYLRGRVEATLGRYLVGGNLDDQLGGGYLDLLDTANHDATAAPFVANQPWHLWAAFPYSLPRWCRYDTSLVPGTLRGIPLVSRTGPSSELGIPSATLLPPAALGLGAGAATTNATMLCAGLVGTAANAVWGIEVHGEDTRHFVYGAYGAVAPTGAPTDNDATWVLVDGTHVPANARGVYVIFVATIAAMANAGTTLRDITLRDFADGYDMLQLSLGRTPHAAGDPAATVETFEVFLPFQSSFLSYGLKSRKVKWTHNYNVNTAGTAAGEGLYIVGWRL